MRDQLQALRNELEHISTLGPLQQVGKVWPVIWKLWALLAALVEQLEEVKHGKP